MTMRFRTSDRDRWLDMIGHAIRLNNPKVTDLSRLKMAARIAGAATLPEQCQATGGPFVLLIRAARALEPRSAMARLSVVDLAWPCLEVLIDTDIGPKSRDGLRAEALRNFDTFRAVLAGLCDGNSDAALGGIHEHP